MGKGLLVVDLDLARLPIKVSDEPIFTEIPRTCADMLRRGQMGVHLCLALWKGTTPGFRPQCLFTYQNPLSCSLALSHVLKCRHACMYVPVHVGVCFSARVLSL